MAANHAIKGLLKVPERVLLDQGPDTFGPGKVDRLFAVQRMSARPGPHRERPLNQGGGVDGDVASSCINSAPSRSSRSGVRRDDLPARMSRVP